MLTRKAEAKVQSLQKEWRRMRDDIEAMNVRIGILREKMATNQKDRDIVIATGHKTRGAGA